jgi:hypothetical protein
LLAFWQRIRWPLVLLLTTLLMVGLALRFDDDPPPQPQVRSDGAPQAPAVPGFLDDGRIDLNSASPELLMTLPQVGEAIAAQIIASRPFSDDADIAERTDLGENEVEALRARAGVQ